MTHAERRRIIAANHQRRKDAIAARRQLIVSLWPTTTVRDIAMMVDMTPDAVCAAAVKAGLKRRPITRMPA